MFEPVITQFHAKKLSATTEMRIQRISDARGVVSVDVRVWYQQDGNWYPSKRGFRGSPDFMRDIMPDLIKCIENED